MNSGNKRYPVLTHCLDFCRSVSPDSFEEIIDIGVQYGTSFLMDTFPGSVHHLFEPVVSYHDMMRKNYESHGIDFFLYPLAIGGESQELYLHQLSSDESGKITHSEVLPRRDENRPRLHSILPVECWRLDDIELVGDRRDLSYCVKMDVDGIEEQIIEGGKDTLRSSSFVVLEASVQRNNVSRRILLMEDLGFRLFDICDNAYYFNQLSCMDLVFINERVRSQELKFRPWDYAKGKVFWEHWQHGYSELEHKPLPQCFGDED